MLRVTHRDNPPSASIHEEATISTDMPFMAVFNNLVVFDPDSKQNRLDRIVPELATSWKWSDDGRNLTFQLRDGVKWHDGKPFTSADVKCTWDMVSGKVDGKMRKNPRKSWFINLREITTNGDREVTFHLKDPEPSFLAMLAGGFSPVYPCHVPAAQMRTHPIGTGPFKFKEFRQNESIKLVRNPDYWKPGKPYLDGIEYTIITSRATMVLALEAGKFDLSFTGELTPELVKDVEAQVPQMQCVVQPSNTQGNLLVNREKAPFDDARIRKAMALAIDRKAFSDILSHGVDQIGGAMLPPPEGRWGWSPEFRETVPGYAADVEHSRAEGRKLMQEAGYGPDKPLQIKVSTRNIALYRDAAVILIDHLKNVYIQGELEPLDSSVWYARLARKDYTVGMNVQGTGIDDPDVMFFENYTCGSERNYTGYCNPELEKQFHRQSMMTDFDARRKLVWDIDKALQEDGARPVIYHEKGGTCWWPQVKGLKLAVNSIYNHWRFDDVWQDR
ncbi:MAG: ABC transporter substrate-binding protein [Rhodospirillales bacterium]|nr:ABC transporter substrate-binding protein [Rhodospirillales bacterium]